MNLKRATLISSAILLVSGLAAAQDVRGLGMGGALLPGPGLAFYNPAYAAYPGAPGSSFTLPLGLLSLFLRPQTSPFTLLNGSAATLTDPNTGFDALAFYDQVTHLNTFILNPPSSPRELTIDIGPNGVVIRDAQGNRINLSLPAQPSTASVQTASGLPTIFKIPFSFGPVSIGLGLNLGVSGPEFTPDAALARALQGGGLTPSTVYTMNAKARASAAIVLDGAFAVPIDIPAIDQLPPFRLYAGARGSVFLGLAYTKADVNGSIQTDANSVPQTGTLASNGTIFLSGLAVGGSGFGVNLDVGVAADIQGVSVGVGILGATSFATWSGQEYVLTGTTLGSGTPKTETELGINPLFTLNAAYQFTPEGFPGSLLVSADVQFGRGAFAGHIGAEANFGFAMARAGIGLENGLRFGLGGSVIFAPGFGLDLALTTHTAPFTNHLDFGVAAALRFGF
jgi:hypothetical protein